MKRRALLAIMCVLSAEANAGGGMERTPQQKRAAAALQKEFDDVAHKQEDVVRAHAKRIVLALQSGDVEALVDECTMYDVTAKDREQLTRKYLLEHKAEMQAAVKGIDVNAADFASELEFGSPEPEAGMTGYVIIPFGPEAPRPADAEARCYPTRHQIELSWSGPLMPDANGPALERAPKGSTPGRWRFYQLVTPYSRKPMYRD